MNLLQIFKGDSVSQQFLIQQNLLPFDLTDKVVSITLKNNSEQEDEFLVLNTEAEGGIEVDADPDKGLITVEITAAQTSGLQAVKETDLDIVVSEDDDAPPTQTFRVKNGLTVLDRNP